MMAESPRKEEFTARCHCGRVQGRFQCNADKLIALDCNCSDCSMRKNMHIVIPQEDFLVDMSEPLEEATILYQWGTKTAIRRFCKTCGILPWYHPRSNPDGVAITVHCVDWTKGGTVQPPKLEIQAFDGVHWEDTMAKLNTKITNLSKK